MNVGGIGQVLVELRQEANLSATALADMLGVDKATISRYESNTTPIPYHRLEQYGEAVGKSREWVALVGLRQNFPALAEETKVSVILERLIKEVDRRLGPK